MLSTSGCSYLFYPHAKDFTEKAKGATGLDTVINLTGMAEASAKAAKGGTGAIKLLTTSIISSMRSTTASAALRNP
ncbi:MAG: hypothetical protein HC794_02435 [Nitrospiraceae bacterium]|nr:hypothetical protein [Nitrospiraceae bacterium]